MSVASAASSGSRRELLIALRDRIATAVDNPDCPKRDLASLSLRLVTLSDEIEALNSAEGKDDLGEATATPDEPFDPSAI